MSPRLQIGELGHFWAKTLAPSRRSVDRFDVRGKAKAMNTQTKTSGKLRMHMSYETAVRVSDIANWAAIVAAVITVFAVFAIYLSGDVKENHTQEKIAHLNESAAKANERAAASELELERLKRHVGPRIVLRDDFLHAMQGQPKPTAVWIFYSEDAPDGWSLGMQLQQLLVTLEWPVLPAQEVKRDNPVLLDPPKQFHGGRFSQISLLAPYGPYDVSKPQPLNALSEAIVKSLGSVGSRQDKAVPPGEIWLVILPKV